MIKLSRMLANKPSNLNIVYYSSMLQNKLSYQLGQNNKNDKESKLKMDVKKMNQLKSRYDPYVNKQHHYQDRKQSKQEGLEVGLIITLSSVVVYILWQYLPYNNMFKHFSISEYVFQKHFYHASLLSSLSFPTMNNLLLYLPLQTTSLYILSRKLNNRQLAMFFVIQGLTNSIVTYLYERQYQQKKFVTPKYGGSGCSLAFSFLLVGYQPNLMLMHSQLLPFFIFPTILLMYEFVEMKEKHVNEVCRPANIVNAFLGIMMGLIFKAKIL